MVVLLKPCSGMCNMRCGYCFYHDESECRTQKSYGMMSNDTAFSIISKTLLFCRDKGIKKCVFAFQGGEPTLRGLQFYKDFVCTVNEMKMNVNISYAIQTNGLEITEEFAKFLAENRFLVGLSLDGPANIHNAMRTEQGGNPTFDRVMQTAALLDRNKAEFNILCVVNSINAKKPDALYNFFMDNEFDYLQFIPCLPPFDKSSASYAISPAKYAFFLKSIFDKWYSDITKGKFVSIRIFDNIINMLHGYPPENCAMKGRCSTNLVIEADGSAFPCDFYALDQWLLGNVNTCSVSELLSSPVAVLFSQRTAQNEKCRVCKYFALCRGGCPRDSEPLSVGKCPLFCTAMTDFLDYSIDRFLKLKTYTK